MAVESVTAVVVVVDVDETTEVFAAIVDNKLCCEPDEVEIVVLEDMCASTTSETPDAVGSADGVVGETNNWVADDGLEDFVDEAVTVGVTVWFSVG